MPPLKRVVDGGLALVVGDNNFEVVKKFEELETKVALGTLPPPTPLPLPLLEPEPEPLLEPEPLPLES